MHKVQNPSNAKFIISELNHTAEGVKRYCTNPQPHVSLQDSTQQSSCLATSISNYWPLFHPPTSLTSREGDCSGDDQNTTQTCYFACRRIHLQWIHLSCKYFLEYMSRTGHSTHSTYLLLTKCCNCYFPVWLYCHPLDLLSRCTAIPMASGRGFKVKHGRGCLFWWCFLATCLKATV